MLLPRVEMGPLPRDCRILAAEALAVEKDKLINLESVNAVDSCVMKRLSSGAETTFRASLHIPIHGSGCIYELAQYSQ